MAELQNFVDNLKNLRVVISVALEHLQKNRDGFVKHATGNHVRDFERLMTQIRTLAAQLARECNTTEYLISKRSPPN
jgi:hypothetical protein